MDDGAGGGRFEVWTSAKNAKAYNLRFAIDGGTGFVGVGTNWDKKPDRPLTIRAQGGSDELVSFQNGAGDVKWHINQNFNGTHPGLNFVETNVLDGRLFLKPGGFVGINTVDPTNPLHVPDGAGIRQGYLFLSGGAGGSSLSYNAYRNPGWTFPDAAHESLTMEFDDANGAPRFQIYRRPPGGNWELKYALNAITGDVTVVGKLGTSGWSPLPRHTDPNHINLGGGIHTWDIEVEGTIWCGHDILGMGVVKQVDRDLAENFTSMTTLEPGDVVCLDPGSDSVVRATRPNDTLALGVVSTKPGFLLNAAIEEPKPNAVPVILSGRCPCKVVDENGPIRRGDLLTSSSTPGHAMKAKPIVVDGREFVQPGTIIGKALGTLESGRGAIDIFAALA
jgi:hypothetical protein